MRTNRAISGIVVTVAGAGIMLSTAGTAAAAPATSIHPTASWDLSLWNGIQGLGGAISSGFNVVFGGSYGGGGNPIGSDQGTWYYQLSQQINTWSHNLNQHGTHTCYDGDTPYPCG
ncbi:hypothetical protein [Nocardia concava]|uniref:hypothetical protein n=1 Tax=Nocardia concava TaxID=257281 RepID=UPI0002F4D645|nr:hypothetical protein [Nocardia concava]